MSGFADFPTYKIGEFGYHLGTMKTITFILLCSLAVFAKDKEADPKPTFTGDEKAPILILQRDAVMANAAAMPANIYAEQSNKRAHEAWAALLKSKNIDPSKWNCNELTFDCVATVQPKAEEAKPETQEKK